MVKAFDTTKVLRHYSDEFRGEYTGSGSTTGFIKSLMVTLVHVLAHAISRYQWKAGETPRRDTIRAIGLLARLDGASVFDQELAVADPLR